MNIMLSQSDKQDINLISSFLSVRDFNGIDAGEIERKTGIKKFDIMVIMPSAVLPVADAMIEAYKKNIAKYYVIAGGVGHSTELLREAVRSVKGLNNIEVDDKSESEIYYRLLQRKVIPLNENVFLDTTSTNCGTNAQNAYRIATGKKLPSGSVLIMQDPLMQLRTLAAFKRYWIEYSTHFFSYVPFVPQLNTKREGFAYNAGEIPGLWSEHRFLSLILGEMLRLKDTENGYGPGGKNFIVHVDIPDPVLEAYDRLKNRYEEILKLRQ